MGVIETQLDFVSQVNTVNLNGRCIRHTQFVAQGHSQRADALNNDSFTGR